mmetsp:Transcript_16692/g.15054  ORF Transcript_16692/g.15054 Transcript_16692/m.15054 type:complete len:130 (+) Transcript_16692:136-525(+)
MPTQLAIIILVVSLVGGGLLLFVPFAIIRWRRSKKLLIIKQSYRSPAGSSYIDSKSRGSISRGMSTSKIGIAKETSSKKKSINLSNVIPTNNDKPSIKQSPYVVPQLIPTEPSDDMIVEEIISQKTNEV